LRKESKDYDVFLEGSVKDEKTENYHCWSSRSPMPPPGGFFYRSQRRTKCPPDLSQQWKWPKITDTEKPPLDSSDVLQNFAVRNLHWESSLRAQQTEAVIHLRPRGKKQWRHLESEARKKYRRRGACKRLMTTRIDVRSENENFRVAFRNTLGQLGWASVGTKEGAKIHHRRLLTKNS
jgi:hypothetical protein